jgi:hypothetical protein
MPLLESDLAVTNPDRALHVEFYRRAVRATALEAEAGHPVFIDEDWVRIAPPGNGLLRVDTRATAYHKQRFPRHWAVYDSNKAELEQVNGTPINQWPLLTPAIAESLRTAGFKSIEQLAAASDQQLQFVHMSAGMAPHVLRDKARAYLENAKNSAFAQKQAEELTLAKKEIESLKLQIAAIQQQTQKKEPPRRGDLYDAGKTR